MASDDLGSAAAIDSWKMYVIVALIAAAVYLGCIVSPPSLQDDVDAVQAQIAKTMLLTGDWVTARLDGVLSRTSTAGITPTGGWIAAFTT